MRNYIFDMLHYKKQQAEKKKVQDISIVNDETVSILNLMRISTFQSSRKSS